jgi:hypothetical protein
MEIKERNTFRTSVRKCEGLSGLSDNEVFLSSFQNAEAGIVPCEDPYHNLGDDFYKSYRGVNAREPFQATNSLYDFDFSSVLKQIQFQKYFI